MRSFCLLCRRLACLVAILALPFHAHAESFALGTVSSPASLSMGNGDLLGAFSDTYSFSIAPGHAFEFDSFLSTGFSRRSFILDMQAALYGGDGLLQSGNAATVTMPEGFPSRNIDFDPFVLGAGNYELRVTGTATSEFPDAAITAAYAGSMDFTPLTTPIPEPASIALMSVGLALLGFIARRRR